MYESILVPLDGSLASEQALPMALDVAERTGARLELVIVQQYGAPPYLLAETPPPDADADREQRTGLDAYIEEVAGRARMRVASVSASVLEGEIAETLIARAAETGASLIVMTTHGRGGVSRMWLGSVAEQIVREIAVPVLLRRPRDAAPAVTGPFTLRRLLVPLDESAVSESVVEPAAALASAFGAEIVLLRVVEPLIVRARIVTAPAVEVDEEDLARQAERAERYLDRVIDRLQAKKLSARQHLMAHHQPARAILDAARDTQADAIAMATRGYGGLRRLVIGSVADKVLRGAECPLMVYRPAKI